MGGRFSFGKLSIFKTGRFPIFKTRAGNIPTPKNTGNGKLIGDITRIPPSVETNYSAQFQPNELRPKGLQPKEYPPTDEPIPLGVKRRPISQKKTPPIDPFSAVDVLLRCDSENDIEKNMKEYFDRYPQKKKGPPTKEFQYLLSVCNKMSVFFKEIKKIEKIAKREARNEITGSVGEEKKRLYELKKIKEMRMEMWDELPKIPKSLKTAAARATAFLATFGITSAVLYNAIKSGIQSIFGSHAGIAALGGIGFLSIIANQPIMTMISSRIKLTIEKNYNNQETKIRAEMKPKIESTKREMRKMESIYVSKVQQKLTTFAGSVLQLCKRNYPDYLNSQYPEIGSGEKLFKRVTADLTVYIHSIYDTIDAELEAPARD